MQRQEPSKVQGLLRTVSRISECLGELGITSAHEPRGNLSSIFLNPSIFDNAQLAGPDGSPAANPHSIIAGQPVDAAAVATVANPVVDVSHVSKVAEDIAGRSEALVADMEASMLKPEAAMKQQEHDKQQESRRPSSVRRKSVSVRDSVVSRQSVTQKSELRPEPLSKRQERPSVTEAPPPPARVEKMPDGRDMTTQTSLQSFIAPLRAAPDGKDITTQTSLLSLNTITTTPGPATISTPACEGAPKETNIQHFKMLLTRQTLEMQSLLDQNEALKRENRNLLKRAQNMTHSAAEAQAHANLAPSTTPVKHPGVGVSQVIEMLSNCTSSLEAISAREPAVFSVFGHVESGVDAIRSGIQTALMFESVKNAMGCIRAIERDSDVLQDARLPREFLDLMGTFQSILQYTGGFFGYFYVLGMELESRKGRLVEAEDIKSKLKSAEAETASLKEKVILLTASLDEERMKMQLQPKPELTQQKTRASQTEEERIPKKATGVQVQLEDRTADEEKTCARDAVIRRISEENTQLLKHQESLEKIIEDWKAENESLRRMLSQKEQLTDDREVAALRDKMAHLKECLEQERMNRKKATYLLERMRHDTKVYEGKDRRQTTPEANLLELKNTLLQSTMEFKEVVIVMNENKSLKAKLKEFEIQLTRVRTDLETALHDNESTQNALLKVSESLQNRTTEKEKLGKDLSTRITSLEASNKEMQTILTNYENQYRQSLFLFNESLGLAVPPQEADSTIAQKHPHAFDTLFMSLLKLNKSAKENLVTLQAKTSELTAGTEKISSRLVTAETQLGETKTLIKSLEQDLTKTRESEVHFKGLLKHEEEKRKELEIKIEKLIRGCIAFASGEPISAVRIDDVEPPSLKLGSLMRSRANAQAF
ncbi:hypothetical protein HDU67_008506 [Dinochytrium kinnereticum]|nr:hypothetical protein HDU67_008506 [Dinochytrium kinnereticum]